MISSYTYDDLGKQQYGRLNPQKWTYVRGRVVYDFQADLLALGFPIKPDGAFGAESIKMVQHFQSLTGLPVTGNGDEATLSKIVELIQKFGDPTSPTNNGIYKLYEATVKSLGYAWDEGNTNIVGIRRNIFNDYSRNSYDDLIVVVHDGVCEQFQASTDPGVKGSAALKAPQQVIYEKGLHQGKYPALRPKVNQIFDLVDKNGKDSRRWGPFNIHAGGNPANNVANWSEGCQVVAGTGGWGSQEYRRFLQLTYHKSGQSEFRYTLIKFEHLNAV